MEVLITTFIASTMTLGTLKVLSVSTQSAAVARSSLIETELRAAVARIISDPGKCSGNLKTSKITGDPGNGRGAINTLADHTDGITDPLITTGQSFQNSLDIVKMELSGSGNVVSPVKRTFAVYYRKTGMGNMNTLGGEPCTDANTGGCYFMSCNFKYQVSSGRATCSDFQNCFNIRMDGSILAHQLCPAGTHLQGFDSSGNRVCKPVVSTAQRCPAGEYLQGFAANGKKICGATIPAQARRTCRSGQYLRGFDSAGRIICRNLPSPSPLPPVLSPAASTPASPSPPASTPTTATRTYTDCQTKSHREVNIPDLANARAGVRPSCYRQVHYHKSCRKCSCTVSSGTTTCLDIPSCTEWTGADPKDPDSGRSHEHRYSSSWGPVHCGWVHW